MFEIKKKEREKQQSFSDFNRKSNNNFQFRLIIAIKTCVTQGKKATTKQYNVNEKQIERKNVINQNKQTRIFGK